jgi:UDP-N-acetyl-D-glucosamine dehydrogenase
VTDLVVAGLGYVGLPVVIEATRAGMSVVGLDVSEQVVQGLGEGRSHVDDISDEDISAALNAGFRPTTDFASAADAKAVVICVPTPLALDGGPDLGAVVAASRGIAPHLAPGCLVVLESTTYPGTTEEVVAPILEAGSGLQAGKDFCLAFSPERVDPGNEVYGLRNTPKVVGGLTEECTRVAAQLYATFVDEVVVAKGIREAESAKLLENTYRHVNIALVNEMARFFHELNIDFWDVIRLADTKPFGFQKFVPGPGVGGHCIPIDPNYLSHRVRTQLGYAFRFVELAQEINATMPAYVVERAQELLNSRKKAVNGSRILLLGITYKQDIADQRESPARPVAQHLQRLGADVVFHDPFVTEWDVLGTRSVGDDVLVAAQDADLTILLQAHSAYDVDAVASTATLFFDTRGRSSHEAAHRL